MSISQESGGRILGQIFHWEETLKTPDSICGTKIIRLSFHSNDPQIVIFSEPRIPNDSKSK